MLVPLVRSSSDPGKAQVVAVAVRPGPKSSSVQPVAVLAAAAWAATGLDDGWLPVLDRHLAAERARGEPGEVFVVPTSVLPRSARAAADPTLPRLLLLAGVGGASATDLRRAGAAVGRAARARATLATALAWDADPPGVRAHVEGVLLGSYLFDGRSRPDPDRLAEVTLLGPHPDMVRSAVARGRETAAAAALARDLANTPSLVKSPAWLARQARAVASRAGLDVSVRKPSELTQAGFGGILAVGAGSSRTPRLIELSWAPDPASRHVVLIGKGITFDSGGLSLKTAEGMVTMKTDMSGGAAVLGAMSVLPALHLPLRVTALVPAAENMPWGSALRPGDVIRHYGGTTVEVSNTDAEGRLVLADALAYADATLHPDVVIDLATLTGSITQGLGRRHAGLFTADDKLARSLEVAGEAAGERVWRMPLVDDYRPAIDSAVADLRNAGDRLVSAGAVTAALFLREFAGSRSWAHLDIAGTARADVAEHEVSQGATGYGARLLVYWLESVAG